VSGRKLQIDYLKRSAPDLARVTWQPYDANLFQYRYFNSWLLPRRVLKKAWRLLARKPVLQRNWEVQFGGDQGETGLRDCLLRNGLRVHQFIPVSRIENLLQSFRADPEEAGRGYSVSMLLTFSAWLEKYGAN
jgi:hypothetical protein